MPRRDSEKDPAKRQVIFCRVVLCSFGVASIGVGVLGLLDRTPQTGLMILTGVIGLVLLGYGAFARDKTCERITRVRSGRYPE